MYGVRQSTASAGRKALPPLFEVLIKCECFGQNIRYLDAILIVDHKTHVDRTAEINVCSFAHVRRYDKVSSAIARGHECASHRHVGDLASHPQARMSCERKAALNILWQEQNLVPDDPALPDAEPADHALESMSEKTHAAAGRTRVGAGAPT